MRPDLSATPAARRFRERKRRLRVALTVTGCLLFLAGLSATCVWAYFAALQSPALRLREVRVCGLVRLEPEQVLRTAGVSVGAPVAALDLSRLESRLSRLAWVDGCRAEVGWPPSLLRINVTERAPVALIRLDSLYYLDKNAKLIKRLSPLEGMDFPVITGLSSSDFDKSRQVLSGRVIPLLAQLGRDHAVIGELSEVHVEPGGRLSLYTTEGVLLRLGERDWRCGLPEAGRVVADLRRRGLLSEVAAVDARTPARVYVSFRRSSGKAAPVREESTSGQAG